MDFERANLLLDIVRKSIDIPDAEKLRDEAYKELRKMNTNPVAKVVEETAGVAEKVVEETATLFDGAAEEPVVAGGRRL